MGLVFGQDVAGVADAAFDLGVDEVIGCDDASLAPFRVEAAGPLLAQLARQTALDDPRRVANVVKTWVATDA